MSQKVKDVPVYLLLVMIMILSGVKAVFTAVWSTTSLGVNTDSNVYKYVVPYNDTYSSFDWGINLKDKLTPTTRIFLNYNFKNSFYNTYTVKDYSQHLVRLNIDEDLMRMLVAGLSLQGDNYVTSFSKYNYLDLSGKFYLRFFMFFYQHTNIDVGLKAEKFNYYNYNFAQEGWTPSLSYREEVSDYNGLARFISIKQGLPANREMELKFSSEEKKFPERPLYERRGNEFVFTDINREDKETNFYLGASQSFKKNSKVSVGFSILNISSNANTTVYDPSVSGSSTSLQEKYYDRKDSSLSCNSLYYYGRENSYLRINLCRTKKDYSHREAQDGFGNWLGKSREDQQFTFFAQINQMLGKIAGLNWILNLGYNYDENDSNDYFYNYINETYSLGLVAYLYL